MRCHDLRWPDMKLVSVIKVERFNVLMFYSPHLII